MDSEKAPGAPPDGDPENQKMHKTSAYFRTLVTYHDLRDRARAAAESLKERPISERLHDGLGRAQRAVAAKARGVFHHPQDEPCHHLPQKYGYVFRPKSVFELILLSGTVCGIEFCYAAETAYVTPTLVSLGLGMQFVTMIWSLSPLVGLLLTPIFGSLSDSCESSMGRRRPFILMYSIGILLGLLFVPNGQRIGIALGDTGRVNRNPSFHTTNSDEGFVTNLFSKHNRTFDSTTPVEFYLSNNDSFSSESGYHTMHQHLDTATEFTSSEGESTTAPGVHEKSIIQPWSILFTVVGSVLLDFCSDACQSPSRTYLLDVSLPEDHATGLSTFTFMAGLGGSIGYVLGAVPWENTFLGQWLGGQVSVVFSIVTVVFLICLMATVCSFPEIPLSVLKDPTALKEYQEKMQPGSFSGKEVIAMEKPHQYGSVDDNVRSPTLPVSDINDESIGDGISGQNIDSVAKNPIEDSVPDSEPRPTLREYLRSIIRMPTSLRILCLTNLFCWMSLVCYSLYFTDFVGKSVFEGDPSAPVDSLEYLLYKEGVQFGCWGMALYSMSCSIYSYFIDSLVKKLGARKVYVGGQLVYSVGMVLMAIFRHKAAVILLSPAAGVMYSTLFTMPYLLIAHYHCNQKFSADGESVGVRGIGTDVAAVSSMVFLSQFVLSLTMGSIVEAVGSDVATVAAAALLSACGALSATQVTYLDI